MPQLEGRLAAKTRELARAERDSGRGAVTALPPGEAQAVREEDVRPMWMAGAVGAVAVLFGGVMVLATRGGGRGGPGARPPVP